MVLPAHISRKGDESVRRRLSRVDRRMEKDDGAEGAAFTGIIPAGIRGKTELLSRPTEAQQARPSGAALPSPSPAPCLAHSSHASISRLITSTPLRYPTMSLRTTIVIALASVAANALPVQKTFDCTPVDQDPYRTGDLVPCCAGTVQKLEGSHYMCRASAPPPIILDCCNSQRPTTWKQGCDESNPDCGSECDVCYNAGVDAHCCDNEYGIGCPDTATCWYGACCQVGLNA